MVETEGCRTFVICRHCSFSRNPDKNLAEELPGELVLELFDFEIYMVHIKRISGKLRAVKKWKEKYNDKKYL